MTNETEQNLIILMKEISQSLKEISSSLSKAEYEKLPRSPIRINGTEYFCVKLGGLKAGDCFYLYEDIKRVTRDLECYYVDDDLENKYPEEVLCFHPPSRVEIISRAKSAWVNTSKLTQHLFKKDLKVYILAK